MRYSPRFWVPVCFVAILLLLVLPREPMVAAGNHVVLIMGGDVEWSLNYRRPTVRYPVADPRPFGKPVFGKLDVRDQVIGDWPPIPYVNEGESKTYLEGLGLKGGSDDSFGESLSYPLQGNPEFTQDYSSNEELLSYPLRLLAHFPRSGSRFGQLRGRSVGSRPPGWAESHAGEVRKSHAIVGDQHCKPRE